MYTAFAEGDLVTLKGICADGLRESLGARIHRRGKEKWTWELIEYTKRAKVMSHRGAPLGIEGMAIRQAVVRISSRQKLTRYRHDGRTVPGTGQEREVKEYLVIQKKMWAGKEDDWIIWGTTEETTLEKLEEQRKAELE
jgi:protein MBA1